MIFRFTLSSEDKGTSILTKEPKGWKDMESIIKRDTNYHGAFIEMMVQLQFTCRAGKEYIDDIYDTFGIDSVININIGILCNGKNGPIIASDYSDDYSDDYGSYLESETGGVFETFFEGTLDLSKYNKNTNFTYVDIIQSDFIQKVMNRFQTKVEVTQNTSLDNVSLSAMADFPSDVTLHSKAIKLIAKYGHLEGIADTLPVPFALDGINIEVPLFVEQDDFGMALAPESPYIYSFFASGAATGYDKTQPIFDNTTSESVDIDITILMQGNLKVRNTRSGSSEFYVLLAEGTQFSYSPFPTQLQLTSGVAIPAAPTTKDININVNYTGTMTVAAGRKLYLVFYFTDIVGNVTTPSTFEFLEFTTTSFNVQFENTSIQPSSSGKIFKIHEVGAAIAQRITSLEDSFRSALLGRKNSLPNSYDSNGCMSFAGIMNGKHLRGFGVANAPLFISMDDYFKTLNAVHNTGLGLQKEGDEYYITIEEKEHFYDNSEVILQCEYAKEVKYSVAKEYFVSELLVGFEKWEVENINGLNEINSKRTFSTGIKSLSNKLSLESPLVGGMYAIELTRRAGQTTNDNTYDDENFIICLNRATDGSGNPNQLHIAEQDENYSEVEGVLGAETSYNLRISPIRSLLRHMNVIAGSLTKYANRAVKFTYGEGNFTASTKMNDSCPGNYENQLISENEGITVEETTAIPIWIPEYIEFEYPLSFTDYLNVKNNKYKCIEVSETNGNFSKGFIIEIRYKPVGGMAYFKLLRAYQ